MAGLVSEGWFTSGLFSDPCRDSPWQNPCSYTANVVSSSAVVAGGFSPLPQEGLCCSRFLFWISLYCWCSLKTWMEISTPCAQTETRCPNSFIDPLKISLPVCKVSLEGPVRKGPWSVLSLQIPDTDVQKSCGPKGSRANHSLSKMGQATINKFITDLVSFSSLWIT